MKFQTLIASVFFILAQSMSLPCHATNYGHDVFSPFVVNEDPGVQNSFCKDLVGAVSDTTEVSEIFQGYEYSKEMGILVDDMGFLPSYRVLPPSPRRLTFNGGRTVVDRDVSVSEIEEVHKLAKEAVAETYAGAIQPEMRAVIDRVEATLPQERSAFGVVRDRATGKIIGVLRIFEGYVDDHQKVILPALEIMRKRNLLTPGDERELLEKLKAEHFYEVGQFVIDRTLPESRRNIIRLQLIAWVKATYLNLTPPNSVMLAHVSTPIHQKHYRQQFGFNDVVLEKSFQGETDLITEKLLATTTGNLKEKLNRAQ